MTERTTYGDLMHHAANRMSEASRLAATQPLPDRANALSAVQAYCHLLTALRQHGWQLVGGDDRQLGVRSRVHVDRRDASAVRLLDTLAAIARGAPRIEPSAVGHRSVSGRLVRGRTMRGRCRRPARHPSRH